LRVVGHKLLGIRHGSVYHHTMSRRKMIKIKRHKKPAGIVTAVMISAYLFSSLGFFCPAKALRSFRALATEVVALENAPSGITRGALANGHNGTARSQGGSSKCCCKKHKKCPAIPSVTRTSNPIHRFQELQFQAKSVRSDALVPQVTEYGFAARVKSVHMEFAGRAPSSCANPLARTCVLLI
jgi:hypothetical protein